MYCQSKYDHLPLLRILLKKLGNETGLTNKSTLIKLQLLFPIYEHAQLPRRTLPLGLEGLCWLTFWVVLRITVIKNILKYWFACCGHTPLQAVWSWHGYWFPFGCHLPSFADCTHLFMLDADCRVRSNGPSTISASTWAELHSMLCALPQFLDCLDYGSISFLDDVAGCLLSLQSFLGLSCFAWLLSFLLLQWHPQVCQSQRDPYSS